MPASPPPSPLDERPDALCEPLRLLARDAVRALAQVQDPRAGRACGRADLEQPAEQRGGAGRIAAGVLHARERKGGGEREGAGGAEPRAADLERLLAAAFGEREPAAPLVQVREVVMRAGDGQVVVAVQAAPHRERLRERGVRFVEAPQPRQHGTEVAETGCDGGVIAADQLALGHERLAARKSASG